MVSGDLKIRMRNSTRTIALVLISLSSCVGFGVDRPKRQLYRGDIPHYRPLDGKYQQSPNNQNFLHDGGINFDFDGNIKTHNLNADNPMIRFVPEDAIIAPGPNLVHAPHLITSNNQIHEQPVVFVEQPVTNHQPIISNAYTTPVGVAVNSKQVPTVLKTERYTVVTHTRN
ncbi:unnamed protein product [Allacma fusca]|uniref:Uncharacterized protein n=1 Tax=Allacma fusca TaxID=39272 RepID=A0A8J2K059_9HEXA|nr:unnamed protein product [Allacma fusca]